MTTREKIPWAGLAVLISALALALSVGKDGVKVVLDQVQQSNDVRAVKGDVMDLRTKFDGHDKRLTALEQAEESRRQSDKQLAEIKGLIIAAMKERRGR